MYRPELPGAGAGTPLRPSPLARERDPADDADSSARDGQERNTLVAWREPCFGLPDPLVEGVRYGMPCYSRERETELAFAAQKRHLDHYLMGADALQGLLFCDAGTGRAM